MLVLISLRKPILIHRQPLVMYIYNLMQCSQSLTLFTYAGIFMELGRSVAIPFILFWASIWLHDICICMSALITFSTPVLRSVFSQWMTGCSPPQWHAEWCYFPFIPAIKILTCPGLWIFCGNGCYFKNSLVIFFQTHSLLSERIDFLYVFRFSKYSTSKSRDICLMLTRLRWSSFESSGM